jgi:hypothetical protein
MHVMGHGPARIARALSVREETIQRLVRGHARTISPPLRDTVASDIRLPVRRHYKRKDAGGTTGWANA